MPYKPELMDALKSEYADASKKFMEARNTNSADAERYLCRMKLIAKDMEYTQQMIDGTLGKLHAAPHAAAATRPGV